MSAVVETLYWLPYCSTCVKAEAFLLEQGVRILKHVNIKEEPLSRAVVEKLAQAVGGPEALFSKRAMKYRSMGLHEQTLTDEDYLRYMVEEYTFIKRPVLVFQDGPTLCGFSKKNYETALKNLPIKA